MRQRIITGLTWRAGVAIAATALAAGTGATAFHLVNDTEAGDGTTIENHATTTTTVDDTTTTTADDHDADAKTHDGVEADDVNADHPEHPDNFGATVSADAQDGGVDGQEISDMAHERNDARQAANEHANANADDKGDDDGEQGVSADHRQDGEHENSGDDSND